jgi:hypothetical protein
MQYDSILSPVSYPPKTVRATDCDTFWKASLFCQRNAFEIRFFVVVCEKKLFRTLLQVLHRHSLPSSHNTHILSFLVRQVDAFCRLRQNQRSTATTAAADTQSHDESSEDQECAHH